MKNKIIILFVIILPFIFQSCATIFSGMKTNVKVKNGTPQNADVYYNGSFVGKAPVSVKVSKNGLKSGNAKISVKKEGYETQETILTRKLKMGAFIGDIIVFPVGHIVDFVTGAIYKPHPGSIEYVLKVRDAKNKELSNNFKVGEEVMFTFGKYQSNDSGKILNVCRKFAIVVYVLYNLLILKVLRGLNI